MTGTSWQGSEIVCFGAHPLAFLEQEPLVSAKSNSHEFIEIFPLIQVSNMPLFKQNIILIIINIKYPLLVFSSSVSQQQLLLQGQHG